MKYFVFIISAFIFITNKELAAQNRYNKNTYTSTIKLTEKATIPIALIGLAVLATNSTFEKNLHNNVRDKVGQNFSYKIDDYTQYAPIVQLYTSKALGFKTENNWFNQTKYLIISNIVSSTIAVSLKRIINKVRPDGDIHAFPSGHTMFAFTNAAVLHKESTYNSRVWANSGYLLACVTGGFRIVNNRHWLSDVLAGAGLGIIATELVYHYKPFKKFNPFKSSKKISVLPTAYKNAYGFLFKYRF